MGVMKGFCKDWFCTNLKQVCGVCMEQNDVTYVVYIARRKHVLYQLKSFLRLYSLYIF